MPKMTNAEIAERARRSHVLKAQAAKITAEAKELEAEVLAELVRRDAAKLEVDDVTVTKLSSTSVSYDYDSAKAALPPAVLRRVTQPTISKTAMAAEIEAGRVDEDVLSVITVVKESAPYVRVKIAS